MEEPRILVTGAAVDLNVHISCSCSRFWLLVENVLDRHVHTTGSVLVPISVGSVTGEGCWELESSKQAQERPHRLAHSIGPTNCFWDNITSLISTG